MNAFTKKKVIGISLFLGVLVLTLVIGGKAFAIQPEASSEAGSTCAKCAGEIAQAENTAGQKLGKKMLSASPSEKTKTAEKDSAEARVQEKKSKSKEEPAKALSKDVTQKKTSSMKVVRVKEVQRTEEPDKEVIPSEESHPSWDEPAEEVKEPEETPKNPEPSEEAAENPSEEVQWLPDSEGCQTETATFENANGQTGCTVWVHKDGKVWQWDCQVGREPILESVYEEDNF